MTNQPPLGATIDQIDTPALCLDLEIVESNIERMVGLCREHGVAWRPHSKGHKSPYLAELQVAAGALGVTCAKLGEAEVMAAGGIRDLLIANQVVGPHKLARLAELCRHADPIVAVDHLEQIEATGRAASHAGVTVRVLVEVDIGMQRAGVAPGEPAVRLAAAAAEQPGVQLAGLMGYEGHLLTVEDPTEKRQRINEAIERLVNTRDALLHAGLPCEIVSAGGTGSYAITVECPGITELQAGGLMYMDAFYRQRCGVTAFEFALKLLTTVVSRPTRDRAIIDAGRKSQNAEIHPPFVVGHDDIHVEQLSAEHGALRLEPTAADLRIGDRLQLVPGYGDFTTVLHDEFYGMRNGRLERILPLVGRGKIR